MIWNLIPVQYRAAFTATICVAALSVAFIAGWKVESWRWDAEKAQQLIEAQKAEKEAQKTSAALQKIADDVQEGATTAVRSVYEYYAKHPNIKYLGTDCVQSTVGSETLSHPSEASSANNAGTINNGHITSSATEEIQVIQPNLVERCAQTTVQALECKNFVEGIYKVYTTQEK